MTWFKVDDGFWCNPKTLMLSNDALALWLRAGTWASQQLTDGQIPARALALFRASDVEADELVSAGMWVPTEAGYEFHHWSEYQPSAEAEKAKRAARAEAGRKGAEARWGGKSDGKPDGNSYSKRYGKPDGKPDAPSRPVPSTSSNEEVTPLNPPGGRSRGSRLDPDWIPDAALVERMRAECPAVDLKAEHAIFVDYWIAQSGQKGVKADWSATWRNWMRRKQADTRGRLTPIQRAQQTAQAGRNVAGMQITSLEIEA